MLPYQLEERMKALEEQLSRSEFEKESLHSQLSEVRSLRTRIKLRGFQIYSKVVAVPNRARMESIHQYITSHLPGKKESDERRKA